MEDDVLLSLCKDILDHHYGTYTKRTKTTLCWTCDTSWPCTPAKLAVAVKEQVLAR